MNQILHFSLRQLKILHLLILVLTLNSIAQNNSVNFNINNGLLSNEIYDIAKDKFGQIWIAGDRGVSVYNGYQFKYFDYSTNLKYPMVTNILKDNTNNLWFSEFNGDLCFQEGYDQLKHFEAGDSIKKKLGSKRFVTSYVFGKEHIYLSYNYAGIYKVNIKTKQTICITPEINDTVIPYLITDIGGKNMACLLKNTNSSSKLFLKVIIKTKKTDTTLLIKLTDTKAEHIFTDRKDGGFICYYGGILIEADNVGKLKIENKIHTISRIIENDKEELMVFYFNNGLRIYKSKTSFFSLKFITLLDNITTTGACYDSEDGLWVSTLQNGVYYFQKSKYTYTPYLQNQFNGINYSLNTSGSNLYYTLNNNKIYSITQHNVLDSLSVDMYGANTITKIGDDLLIHSKKGLELFSNKKTKLLCKSPALSIYKEDSIIYIGTYYKIYVFNSNLKAITNTISTNFARVTSILKHKNNLIFGTSMGIFEIDHIDQQLLLNTHLKNVAHPFLNKYQFNDYYVKDIAEQTGNLIIATIGNGIMMVDENKNVKYLNTNDGLLSNNIEDLELIKNDIYVASNLGINKISQSKTDYKITTILTSHQAQVISAKKIVYFNANLWVLSTDGIGLITEIKDVNIKNEGNYQIPTYINTIEFGDKLQQVNSKSKSLKINYNQANRIEIKYFGLSYRNNSNIKYLYRLIGNSNDWRLTNATSITFYNLKDGDFTFEIKAITDDKTPSNYIASFKFHIDPPFYKTTYFYIICTLLVTLLITFIINLRIRVLKNRIKYNLINQKATVSQINPHFIFNVLNSINSDIILEDKKTASNTLVSFSKMMRQNLNNSTKQLVPILDDISALEYYLELEQYRNNVFNYNIKISPEIDTFKTSIPPMLIQPFVENAVRHAFVYFNENEKGLLNIEIFYKNKNLTCKICDNGIGINKSKEKKKNSSIKLNSLGISITMERLIFLSKYYKQKEYCEIFDLIESNELGTCVEFYLPYKII